MNTPNAADNLKSTLGEAGSHLLHGQVTAGVAFLFCNPWRFLIISLGFLFTEAVIGIA